MARPIAIDYDDKRFQILKSAAHVFAREGVTRASMNLLAAEIGISKANIYHYYESKDALLFDILDTYLSQLRDRVCSLQIGSLAPDEQLHRVISDILNAYEGMDDEHKIQIEGIPQLPDEQQEILRTYQREIVAFVSQIVAQLVPENYKRKPKKLQAITMSIFGMLNWYYMWNKDAGPRERTDYAKLVASIALNGVRGL